MTSDDSQIVSLAVAKECFGESRNILRCQRAFQPLYDSRLSQCIAIRAGSQDEATTMRENDASTLNGVYNHRDLYKVDVQMSMCARERISFDWSSVENERADSYRCSRRYHPDE